MNIPEARDSIWFDVITGKKEIAFSFLAIKILLSSLRISVKNDSSPGNVERCSNEFRQMLIKNQQLPKVISDIEQILK